MADAEDVKPKRKLDILADGIKDFYRAQGYTLGQIDLFLFDRHNPTDQILAVLEGLVGFVDPESRRTIFSQVVVLVPATAFELEAFDPFVQRLMAFVQRVRNASPAHQLPGDWLQVRTVTDYQQSTLDQAVGAAAPNAAVIVYPLADFRSPDVVPHDPGGSKMKFDEDLWAPHVVAGAKSLEKIAEAAKIYIAGLVGRLPPRRAALRDALQIIKGAIQYAEVGVDLETELMQRESEITAHLEASRIGAAMALIDAMPEGLNSQKPFLKVQFLDRAGLHQPALDIIEKDFASQADELDPVSLVRMAITADRAGGNGLAARFLRLAIPQLTQRETLEAAFDLACGLPQYDLTEPARARLHALFPDSFLLQKHELDDACAAGNFERAAALAANLGNEEAAAFYRRISALTADPAFDYIQVLAQLAAENGEWRKSSHPLLIREAMRRGRLFHGFRWALDADAGLFSPYLLLETLERFALERGPAGEFALADEDLQVAVGRILRYLATHLDPSLRTRLIAFLSPETIGLHGMSLAVVIASKAINRAKRIRFTPLPNGLSDPEYKQLSSILQNAMRYLDARDNLVLGRATIPAEMVTMPVERACRGIGTIITEHVFDLSDPNDIKMIGIYATVGGAIAAHEGVGMWDIELMRLAGARLATGGHGQAARDYAETAFQVASNDPVRQHAAWLALADIYQRINNRLEAFVFLAAAALSESERNLQSAWEELQIFMRLSRDLRMFDQALKVLDAMEQLSADGGMGDANKARLEFMRLQIGQQMFSDEDADPEALADFLKRFADHVEVALRYEGDLLPVAVSFGQLLMRAHELKVPVPDEIQKAYEQACSELPKDAASFVRIISAAEPSKADVFSVACRAQPARYADDAGTDVQHAAMVARRALSGASTLQDAAATALSTELLADRAVPLPGWEAVARPPTALAGADSPLDMAQALSLNGAAVILLGLNDDAAMVRTVIKDGQAEPPVVEDSAVFSYERWRSWREEFPFRYGVDRETPNLFFTSTEGLAVSWVPDRPAIVVADTGLQTIPPNLWRIGESFLGLTQPCAAAPSLSWLSEAQQWTAPTTRKVAWISAADDHGHTLNMVADRLQDTFEAHHIELDRSEALPKGFDGAELAIVTAHGGLMPDGSFFQVVRDEGKVVVDAGDFAGAFHNVGLVVLFVCSGGRQDRHPNAVTTIGLVKRVLRAGCATIIASPWPMDARIPSHWLPVFLQHWMAGATAMEANFAANHAVGQAMGGEPAETLALNVFGDPYRKKRTET